MPADVETYLPVGKGAEEALTPVNAEAWVTLLLTSTWCHPSTAPCVG